jgi:nitrogen regulatory protein PII
MKRVEVVLKSSALDTFNESAASLGISEYDVSEVRFSPSLAVKERRRLYRGHEYTLDLLARVKIGFAVLDQDVKRIAQDLLTLASPDSITIFALDELITMGSNNGHRVARSRTEHEDSELPAIMHH